MSTIKQYTSAGEAAADLTVDEAQLVLDKGAQALKDAVDAIRAGMRAGTASTLAKGEVAGSNKKPWKQKGTGNARAGFRQSPVWRGGGVAHGPRPRSFVQKVNKKVMKLAFARAFSDKLAAGDVIVLDEFKFEAPKTKLMVKLLKELDVTRTACIVQKDVDDTVVLAASNIPTVDYSTAQALDVYTVLANRKLVCDKAGFDALMARIAK
jgi:large subunit ribosomal protein L4